MTVPETVRHLSVAGGRLFVASHSDATGRNKLSAFIPAGPAAG